MRKVIDGKRYDTETAERVYGWDNGRYTSDFRNRSKDLYHTKSGAWFLHHVGGARTDMGVAVGTDGMGGSEQIEAVSPGDAYGFLEAHSDDRDALAAIERYFADRVSDA